MDRIKVGYVVSSLNFGGVEKYVVDLANNVSRDKFEPYLFSFLENGPLKKFLKEDVRLYEFKKKVGNDPRLPFWLAARFHQLKIEVLHSNNWSTFAESVAARWMARVPAMLHAQHGIEKNEAEKETTAKRCRRNLFRRGLSLLTEKIVVVSRATEEFVSKEWGVRDNKIKLIYNGVLPGQNNSMPTSSFLKIKNEIGIEKDYMVVGSVGRLMKVKNYDSLIRAFGQISREIQKCKLMLVGDGPEKQKLKNLAASLGIEDRVIFLGNRNDVDIILQCLDIFVLPSFSEGVSIALLEAMAASRPVIATNVGGNPEVVKHMENGLLVPSDNSKLLANAIELLVKNKSLCLKLGNSAKETVMRNFHIKKMIKSYEALYEGLAKHKKSI